MERYFDFNHTFTESVSQRSDWKEIHKDNWSDFRTAWNQQSYANQGLHISAHDVKRVEQITKLMKEYKEALQQQFGVVHGIKKYQDIFLEGGSIKEADIAKTLYNAIRYSINYGAAGKNITESFFAYSGTSTSSEMEDSISNQRKVKDSVSKVFPKLPENFLDELIKEHREEKNKNSEMFNEASKIGETLGRSEQIEFIKKNIDSMYTNSQRFKEAWSDINGYYKETNPITAVLLSPVVVPLIATVTALKVFGGEAGQMKINDVIEGISKKMDNIKDKVAAFKDDAKVFFKLPIADKIQAIRKSAIENEQSIDKKFKF